MSYRRLFVSRGAVVGLAALVAALIAFASLAHAQTSVEWVQLGGTFRVQATRAGPPNSPLCVHGLSCSVPRQPQLLRPAPQRCRSPVLEGRLQPAGHDHSMCDPDRSGTRHTRTTRVEPAGAVRAEFRRLEIQPGAGQDRVSLPRVLPATDSSSAVSVMATSMSRCRRAAFQTANMRGRTLASATVENP